MTYGPPENKAVKPPPQWMVFMVAGTINEHLWMSSDNPMQPAGDMPFDPEECGPCQALVDMPRDLLVDCAREYARIGGAWAAWDEDHDDMALWLRNLLDQAKKNQ